MKKVIYMIWFFTLLQGCVEPFMAETQIFDGILVVDAKLTDEEKIHEILLSRARPFEQDSIVSEGNALVSITSDSGTEYFFDETMPGVYRSTLQFKAQQNNTYQLKIQTVDGIQYSSDNVKVPEIVGIDEVYATKDFNESGEPGVAMFVNAMVVNTTVKFFRYEYEETYKIIAPFWNPFDFDIIDDQGFASDGDNFEVGIKPRVQEERICYNSLKSTSIIQASTSQLDENQISKKSVRFIEQNNAILSHRYSVLVKQYAQNADAFFYYQNLKDFSSRESVFSETQPGFLEGNIKNENENEQSVIGYFEVTSVDAKRVFFDYSDIFPNEPIPPYFVNCEPVQEPLLWVPTANTHELDGGRSPLIQAIRTGLIKYHATNEAYVETFEIDEFTRGPYFAKSRACGDCTALGSNEKPNFWIE